MRAGDLLTEDSWGESADLFPRKLISVIAALRAALTVFLLNLSFEAIDESSSMSTGRIESEEWFDMLVDFLRRGCTNDGGLRVEIISGFDVCGEPKLESQSKLTLISTRGGG